MRILFVAPRFPYPPFKGDQMVAFHRMRSLSERHQVFLLCLYETSEQLKWLPELQQFCTRIYTVHLPRWRSILNILAYAAVSKLPAQVLYYRSKRFASKVAAIVAAENIDVVHAVMLRVAPAVSRSAAPVLMDFVDSMQLNLRSRLSRAGALRRMLIGLELGRIKDYERQTAIRFGASVVVSAFDQRAIDGGCVHVVPLGVDLDQFDDRPDQRRASPTIVFTGNLSYEPNVTAIRWFVRNCFARIQKRMPTVHLVIAGTNPPESIRSLAESGSVEVHDTVPSMAATINQAWVAIAPMQSGSGMQFKVLEAMACGVPVVATTYGIGDIGARAGVDLMKADDAADFAQAVADLLDNRDRAASIGENGRQYVRAHHGWQGSTAHIERLYASLLTGEQQER